MHYHSILLLFLQVLVTHDYLCIHQISMRGNGSGNGSDSDNDHNNDNTLGVSNDDNKGDNKVGNCGDNSKNNHSCNINAHMGEGGYVSTDNVIGRLFLCKRKL